MENDRYMKNQIESNTNMNMKKEVNGKSPMKNGPSAKGNKARKINLNNPTSDDADDENDSNQEGGSDDSDGKLHSNGNGISNKPESEDRSASDSEDGANDYIMKSLLGKLLELALSTLNSEDDGVVNESLTTLKSIVRCYRSLDLPKYIPTIITRLKKF